MADKKRETKKETTKAPSGLTITREGSRFTFKWKINDSDYGQGQQLQVSINDGAWTSISIGKTATTKSYSITAASWFPNTSKKLKKIEFRVRGRKKDTTKESSKTITTYEYSWSAWETKSFSIKVPNEPEVTATLSTSESNVCTYAWEVKDVSTSAAKWFTDVVYQTILVENCNSVGKKQAWERSNAGWGTAGGQAASGSISRTETIGNISKTRFVRVKARGPAGETDWVYMKHVYAKPGAAEINTFKVKKNSMFQVTMKWKAANTKANPVEKGVVQYTNVVPAAGMTVPSGSSWTDIVTMHDTSGNTVAAFPLDVSISADHAVFVRVMTEHDPFTTSRTYSANVTANALIGSLTAPSNLSVTHGTGNSYTVSATNNCEIPDSVIAIYELRKGSSKMMRKGTIPAGSTSPITISVSTPTDVGFSIVAQAEVTAGSYSAKSTRVSWDSTSMPTAPTGLTLTNNGSGIVAASWTNTWALADGTELSWSQDPNAWESTNEPDTYSIGGTASKWYVVDLEVGTWYFRVRSSSENNIFGPWSDTVSINLAQKPAKPVPSLTAGKIGLRGNTVLSWTYFNTDGTAQGSAEVCHATISNGVVTSHSPVIAITETAQSCTLYAEDLGWTAGEHNVCVRVTSEAGQTSDWSDPITVTVAAGPSAIIAQSSLTNVTVTDDVGITRTVTALTEMPFTITVTGANAGGTTTVIIERVESYFMDRPDEDRYGGYEGETVAIVRQTGDGQITITNDDLIGRLDDGAAYQVIAEVTDTFGQTNGIARGFEVHWSHQAEIPTATVVADSVNLVAMITPIEPENAETGDVCDIYRLSADKPELIYAGAEWGTTYVDPYPTLGINGGHRIVMRTVNGDYITEDNQPAWTDYGEDEDDIIELPFPATVIDFDGNRAVLNWNMKVSSKWTKDFTETKYLGGAVQGDWNIAVSRSTTVSATAVQTDDPLLINVMRRLADFAGICHVRTPDGSSFAADVEVSESSYEKFSTFDLTIRRVDPEGFEGLTLAEWEEQEDE